MEANEVTSNLWNRIVEGTVVTQAEMIKTINENNKQIFDHLRASEEKLLYRFEANDSKMTSSINALRSEIKESNSILRSETKESNSLLRNEMKADRKWLIGLFITAIIAIPTLIKLLSHFI